MSTLNPGIVRTVSLLNANGFVTSDSGDGETGDYQCDRDYGYVVVLYDGHDLYEGCDEVFELLRKNVEEKAFAGVAVNGCYDPRDKIALIDISYVHDRMLK